MNNKFDELARSLAVTRHGALKKFGLGLAGLAVAALFVGQAHAADLFADSSVSVNGDGSAARPYWRITDAVERARLLRQSAAIPSSERIVILVASGTYLGSKENSVLKQNPRLEVLPIVLNVPDLTLSGATGLQTDADGLPTGIQPGTETVLATEEHTGSFGDSLLLITRTTDGEVGDRVTVEGLVFDQPSALHNGTDIFVDRVADFALRGNVILRAFAGITSQNASGTIEGNLALHNFGPGIGYLTGGSAALPARLIVRGNRAGDNEGGAMLTAAAFSQQPHVWRNSLEVVSQQQTLDKTTIPDTLDVLLLGNDFSDNHTFGVRLVAAPFGGYTPLDPKEGLSAKMTATVGNNRFNHNGHYGISVDAAFALLTDKRPDSFSFAGVFQGNELLGNGRAAFLFAFSSIWLDVNETLGAFKFLHDSNYEVTDLDGEVTGFDFDNPALDPYDGATVLNNILIVNGTVVPQGRKISPLGP